MAGYQDKLKDAHKIGFNIFALADTIGREKVLPAMALDAIKKNGLE